MVWSNGDHFFVSSATGGGICSLAGVLQKKHISFRSRPTWSVIPKKAKNWSTCGGAASCCSEAGRSCPWHHRSFEIVDGFKGRPGENFWLKIVGMFKVHVHAMLMLELWSHFKLWQMIDLMTWTCVELCSSGCLTKDLNSKRPRVGDDHLKNISTVRFKSFTLRLLGLSLRLMIFYSIKILFEIRCHSSVHISLGASLKTRKHIQSSFPRKSYPKSVKSHMYF